MRHLSSRFSRLAPLARTRLADTLGVASLFVLLGVGLHLPF